MSSIPTNAPPPAEDAPLLALFEQVFRNTAVCVSWKAAAAGMSTESVADAARALGIQGQEGAIAKTMICRWKLTDVDPEWSYVTVFVAGEKHIDDLMLQSYLGVTKAQRAPKSDVMSRTGCAPGAIPPIFLPAIVDNALLDRGASDDEVAIYVSGLTEKGLYRLSVPDSTAGGARAIFDALLGEYDVLSRVDWADENEDEEKVRAVAQEATPMSLAQPLLTVALCSWDFSTQHTSDLWMPLFNAEKDLSAVHADIAYWRTKKGVAARREEEGDNEYIARLCDGVLAARASTDSASRLRLCLTDRGS